MRSGARWLIGVFGRSRAPSAAEAYRRIFAVDSPDSRLVLADLAQYCRIVQTSFIAGDPHQTAFNEGARDVYLHICEMAGLRPADFPQPPSETSGDPTT